MSHSKSITKEFGALKVLVDQRIQFGSTSDAVVTITPAPTMLADAAATLTVAQLKTGILIQTPTTGRTLTLPTAALMKGFLATVGATVSVTFVNLGEDTNHITVQIGSGGALVGSGVVRDASAVTDSDSGSATFKIRMTNITSSSEAYIVYRSA